MDPSTLIIPGRPTSRSAAGASLLADRYRIGEVIGRGGMSTVYRARDTVLDRDVAVKVLLSSLVEGDPTNVARFEREARAAASLKHPAVVKIFDTGQDGSTHFIVMELVPGVSLAKVLAEGRSLDPERASRIAAGVAGALAAAHAAGIVHRDVKPANVMITTGHQVKVLDFGIARGRNDPTLTQTAFAIGTAAYMSPERVNGQPGDERSDVYSLGCLLYAMLTGRPPFVADDVLSVLHQQLHDPPIPPSRRGAAIAAALDDLVLGMLAKDPAARPQSASVVAARLAGSSRGRSPLVGGAPISRHSTAPRRRSLAGLLLVAAALLVVVILGSGGGPSGAGMRQSRVRTQARAKPVSSHPAGGRVHLTVTEPQSVHPEPPEHAGLPPGHGGVPPGHRNHAAGPRGGPPGHQDHPAGPGGGPHQPGGHGGDGGD